MFLIIHIVITVALAHYIREMLVQTLEYLDRRCHRISMHTCGGIYCNGTRLAMLQVGVMLLMEYYLLLYVVGDVWVVLFYTTITYIVALLLAKFLFKIHVKCISLFVGLWIGSTTVLQLLLQP